MPWSKKEYPDSMKNSPEDVRAKAIGIANANALLEVRKSCQENHFSGSLFLIISYLLNHPGHFYPTFSPRNCRQRG